MNDATDRTHSIQKLYIKFPRRGTNGDFPRRGTNGDFPRRGTNGDFPRRGTNGDFPRRGTNGDFPRRGPRKGTNGGLPAFAAVLALLWAAAAGGQQRPAVPDDVAAPPADAERTASGLASKVLTPGTGDVHPDGNDLVAVHFTGWTPQGVEFQTTFGQEKPAVFNLQDVFPGWIEAMQLMVAGEKRRLWIPARLGPQNPKTGPKGDSVFDVEMMAVRHVPNPPAELRRPPAEAERTASGATTRRVETGWGDEFPAPDSAVLMHYTGWTIDGKTFDSSVIRGRPTAFPLDKVMTPFAEAVQRMVVGEKRQVWIPGNLAAGNWPGSPQGMLIFELQLVQILPEGSFQRGAIPQRPPAE